MATLDDKILDVLDKIEKHLKNGNRSNSSDYFYSPTVSNNESVEEKRERELKYQDMLDARIRGRHLTALMYEKELHQTKQEHLQKEFDGEKEKLDKLKKYKDKSIEELEKKLKRKGLSDKTKKDILEAIEHLKKMDEIQHQMTIDEREFARSQYGKNKFTELSKSVSEFSDKMVKAYKSVRNFVEPWAKADHAASKFTKTLGGTKAALDAIRKQSLDNVALGFGTKYNISTEELIQAQNAYLKDIGRNINMSDNAQESMAAIRAVAGDGALNLASQFENFGVSMVETGDHIGKMFSDASKNGLSFEKYSENVTKNIRIAQNYTFKDGLKGLENMAKKATSIKLDMQQVANFAEKVGNIEGAIETAGKLQVLGGPFASMADPMGMLTESLTDMEGFQDRVIKLYGQMGHFDKTTGQVTVSAFDKLRLKQYAEATGQDYSSIMETVHASAKKSEIMNQINGSAKTAGFDDEMKELIANTATFKDGKAGVSIKGKFKTLDELSIEDKEAMQQLTQTESQDIKQIAMDLRSLVDKEEGLKKQADAIQGEIASPFGRLLKWVHGIFDLTGVAVTILGAIKAMQAIGSIGNSGFDLLDMFGGRKGRVASKLFKGSIGRSGKRVLIKAFGRKGATKILGRTATKVATTATGTATSGVLAGLGTAAGGAGLLSLGLVGNKLTNQAVENGKIEKGGLGHHAAKGASGAAIGAGAGITAAGIMGMVGALAPALAVSGPIGWILGAAGAAVGATIGLVKASKAKNEKIIDEQLKSLGIERKGDYNRRKLKKIDKALQTGELSNRMRRKLIQRGDIELVKEIEKVKEKKELKKKEKEEIRKIRLKTANISIGSANISGVDFSNRFNKLNRLTLGEGVDKAISIVKGYKEDGLSGAWEAIRGRRNHYDNTNNSINNKKNSFDININGSLKLTGENGQSVDIINELKSNPALLRSLADMISKEISILDKGTYIPQRNGK